MADVQECVVCKNPGYLKCGRCDDPYCSPECQKIDWRRHKFVCVEMPKLLPLHNKKFSNSNLLLYSIKPAESLKYIPQFNNDLDNESNNDKNKLKFSVNDRIALVRSTEKKFYSNFTYKPLRDTNSPIQLEYENEKITENSITLNSNDDSNSAIAVKDEISHKNLRDTNGSSLLLEDENKKYPETSIILNENKAKKLDEIPCSYDEKPINLLSSTTVTTDLENIELKNNWKTIFPNDRLQSVEVMVQFVEEYDSNILWVTAKACNEDMNYLLQLINEKITNTSESCLLEEIDENQLVAAPFDGLYYRAIIVSIIRPLRKVLLRLIDYGNEIIMNIDEIKPPIQEMYEYNTFAFQVKLLTPRTDPVKICETITIKWFKIDTNGMWIVNEIGYETFQQIVDDVNASVSDYMDDMEKEAPEFYTRANIPTVDIPENISLQMSILDFTNFFTDFTVTAAILNHNLLHEFDDLNLSMLEYCKNDSKSYGPHVGEICCALFEDGKWYRAECLKNLTDDNFLIKFIDYGNMEEVNAKNIRKISADYLYPTIAYSCIVNTEFLSMAKPKDLIRIFDFLQSDVVEVANVKKIDDKDQYMITVVGLENIFGK